MPSFLVKYEKTSDRLLAEGRKAETAKVTELMATELLAVFEERSIEIPNDAELRADLVKPEKITSPGGRVSIAATRDEAGHADHFWAIALAIRAAGTSTGPVAFSRVDEGSAMRSVPSSFFGMGKIKPGVFLSFGCFLSCQVLVLRLKKRSP